MAIASFIFANNSSKKSANDLEVSNIEALNASAAEMSCEDTDDHCTITVGDMTGVGKGRLSASN